MQNSALQFILASIIRAGYADRLEFVFGIECRRGVDAAVD